MNWYRIDTEAVFKQLQTSEYGLFEQEAKSRLEREGPNKLPEAKGVSPWKLLLHQFASPLIYILVVAAVVTAFLGKHIDTGVIAAVLILNATIGFWQEYKAEKSVRALDRMVVSRARVVRGGRRRRSSARLLCPAIWFS